jgi:hypothetical protein
MDELKVRIKRNLEKIRKGIKDAEKKLKSDPDNKVMKKAIRDLEKARTKLLKIK